MLLRAARLTPIFNYASTRIGTLHLRGTIQFSRMASTLPRLPVFEAIARHDPKSTAVVHSLSGRRFTYGELLNDVADTKATLESTSSKVDLRGERVAFLVENCYDYVGASTPAIV